jgi:REP element-mobilizing transposase RayT
MSERYKVLDSLAPTFITITVVDWIDLFTRRSYCEILDNSLNYCINNKGLKIHAYVYMTNHIHLIISSEENKLNEIVRDFKKYTSKELISAIKTQNESRKEWMLSKFEFEAKRTGRATNYKLWQDGFHPVILDNRKKMEQRVNYIHYNPIEAGYVLNEKDWINSSYLAYQDNTPRLNVKVEPLW